MKKHKLEYNYWQPIVDIMTGIALFFFLLLIVFSGIQFFKSNSAEKFSGKGTIDVERYYTVEEYQDLYSEYTDSFHLTRRQYEMVNNLIEQRNNTLKKIIEDVNQQVKMKSGIQEDLLKTSENSTSLYIQAELLFEFGKADLKTKAIDLARELGRALQKHLDDGKIESIEVIGHTDNVGYYGTNMKLGCDRANTFVWEMLVGIGGDAFTSKLDKPTKRSEATERINKYGRYFKASGYAMFAPDKGAVDEPQSSADAAANRRIEIRINFTDEDFKLLLDEFNKTE